MAYLNHEHQDNQPSTTDNRQPTPNLGALTPSTTYAIRQRPQPKPEPWRPANAGRVALRPDRRLLADLKLECLKEGITLTHWFELQAVAYLRSRQPDAQPLGAQAPQIDRMTLRKQENPSSIGTLFQFWTAAYNNQLPHHHQDWRPTWTDRDATAAAPFEDANIEAVEIAMIYVILRGTAGHRRIKAFRYYVEEIETQLPLWADQDPAMVTVRLLTLRQTAAQQFRVQPPPLTPEQKKIADGLKL